MVREEKSSGCIICGYDRYYGALAFHHLNGKDMEVGQMKYHFEFVREASRHPMVVLCSNCHRELHGGVISDVCLWGRAVEASQP